MSLFLVPASDPAALRNLGATVMTRVGTGRLAGLRKETLKKARSIPGGVAAWGTKPGKRDSNVSTWRAMEPGDWVLFYSDGRFTIAGRVLAREHSRRVARRLWGADAAGTWEYMYLLDELRQIDATRLSVLAAIGYKKGYHLRGFTRVKRDIAARSGSVERLLEDLAGKSFALKAAVDAAWAGDDAAVAVAVDRIPGSLSRKAVTEAVAAARSSDPPKVQRAVVNRIIRDRKLATDLKALYGGRCQCCGFTFLKQDGTPYSEAAHILGIAGREANLDVKDNLLVLCPNHHKMLDLGPLEIRYDPVSDRLMASGDGEAREIENRHIGPGRPDPEA